MTIEPQRPQQGFEQIRSKAREFLRKRRAEKVLVLVGDILQGNPPDNPLETPSIGGYIDTKTTQLAKMIDRFIRGIPLSNSISPLHRGGLSYVISYTLVEIRSKSEEGKPSSTIYSKIGHDASEAKGSMKLIPQANRERRAYLEKGEALARRWAVLARSYTNHQQAQDYSQRIVNDLEQTLQELSLFNSPTYVS